MANYFGNFPRTFYTKENNSSGVDLITNILSRFSFEKAFKENTAVFYKYQIQDSDTPEIIAAKYYDDPEKHWIVLLFNDIIDPQYNWPLKYSSFINYVNEKYAANGASNTTVQSGITWAQSQNNIHSYYQVNTRTSTAVTADSKTIKEKVRITANAYANVIVGTTSYTLKNGTVINETVSKEKLTYYDYEMEENEAKRKIKLLKPEFATDVFEEFKEIVQ